MVMALGSRQSKEHCIVAIDAPPIIHGLFVLCHIEYRCDIHVVVGIFGKILNLDIV
jgi:hypothetical protein